MRKIVSLSLLALLSAGCSNSDPAVTVPVVSCESKPGVKTFEVLPTDCLKQGADYQMTLETDRGTLTFDLLEKSAPLATGSMLFLSESGFYNNLRCHRAIQGFVLQCGDPTGTGAGGPGYVFRDELTGSETYPAGTLAMANSGPNTNGSQFFVVTGNGAANLPPNYTVFGTLETGQESILSEIDSLGNPDPSANGVPPLEYVTVKTISVTER